MNTYLLILKLSIHHKTQRNVARCQGPGVPKIILDILKDFGLSLDF